MLDLGPLCPDIEDRRQSFQCSIQSRVDGMESSNDIDVSAVQQGCRMSVGSYVVGRYV